MNTNIPKLPHGHGLSYKRGVSDGLLGNESFREQIPNGHEKSYEKGIKFGEDLKKEISEDVKK